MPDSILGQNVSFLAACGVRRPLRTARLATVSALSRTSSCVFNSAVRRPFKDTILCHPPHVSLETDVFCPVSTATAVNPTSSCMSCPLSQRLCDGKQCIIRNPTRAGGALGHVTVQRQDWRPYLILLPDGCCPILQFLLKRSDPARIGVQSTSPHQRVRQYGLQSSGRSLNTFLRLCPNEHNS